MAIFDAKVYSLETESMAIYPWSSWPYSKLDVSRAGQMSSKRISNSPYNPIRKIKEQIVYFTRTVPLPIAERPFFFSHQALTANRVDPKT